MLPGSERDDDATTADDARRTRNQVRVLLAAGDVDTREHVTRLLGQEYEVVAAGDGAEALRAARAQPFDAVLIDVIMPRLYGFGLLKELRADERTKTLPVIMLSDRAGEEARGEAMEAGADDYLVKPFTAKDLRARVGARLEIARVRRKAEAVAREAQEALRRGEERYRSFVAQSSEGIWRFEVDPPPAVTLPPDEQIEHFYRHAYLAECNDAMARMYGYDAAGEIVGARANDLLPASDPANIAYLRAFIAANYRLTEAESREPDRDGNIRYFLNNLVGIVEDGRLTRAWGTQRDVTESRRAAEALRESEERYRTLFESIDEGFCIAEVLFDERGNPRDYLFLETNAVFGQLTGLAGAVGKSARQLVPDLEEFWFETYGRVASTGASVRFENYSAPMNRWFDVHASRVGGAESRRIAIVFTNITERKRADQALRESEARFRNMADHAPVMVWVTDPDGSCTYLSQSWYKFTGQTPETGLDYGWLDATHPDDAQAAEELFLDSNRRHAPFRLEYRLRRGDGEYRWAIDSAQPRFSDDGEFLGYIGSVIDITERKEAEETLREAMAREQALRGKAEEANRLKDEFLATVSHELRTPLTAMLGWAHMLRANRLDETGRARALETIERNARSQQQLVEDLLDVSRIITGKLRLDVRPCDPASFIEAAVEAVRPAAEAKDVRLQKVLDPGTNSVAGDPARLQQVVWNLLANAIKFTPKGGRVQVRLERVNSHTEIIVTDTGAGIEAEFLPHVFDRFRQADGSTTRAHGGLGLGLSIVRHLVELHGGTVEADSEGLGRGATFTVKLPLISVHTRETTEGRVHPRADVAPLLPIGDSERLDSLKVVVVDDEPDSCELLKAMLAQCGAEVVTALSAEEALAAIESFQPDVLISDIGMPATDGYELMRRLRRLPAGRGGTTPAIALTAYARAEDRLRALRAGYQMHVPKPVEAAELIAVVASLAGRPKKN